MRMRIFGPWMIIAGLCMGGCRPSASDPLADRLHQQEERLARLEARLSEADSQRRTELSQLLQKLSDQTEEQRIRLAEMRRAQDALTLQLSETQRTLGDVETALRKATAEIAVLKQARSQTQTAATIPPPPSAPVDAPLQLSGIVGEKVVTGTHTSTRLVPTEKFERDAMGNKTRVMEQEEVEVNEYGFQVRFEVRNPSARPRDIEVSAGPITRRFSVPAEGQLTNAAVPSVMGSELTVTEGSQSRRYPVEYREP